MFLQKPQMSTNRVLKECVASARRGRESSKNERLLPLLPVLNKSVFSRRCNFRHHSTMAAEGLSSLKLITFDVTGTLLTFKKPPLQIYKEFGEKHGIRCEMEEMKASFKLHWKELSREQPHFGTNWEAWWTALVIKTFKGSNAQGANEAVLQQVASDLIDHFKTSECWKVENGARELVFALQASSRATNAKLKQKFLATGIISNFDPRLYELLKVFQMDKFFAPVILSHEHQISKPSPEIFNKALHEFMNKFPEQGEIQPFEAMHVGDNYELDFVGAKNAGWKGCLIAPNFDIRDIPEEKRSFVPMEDEVYQDLHSFLKFLSAKGGFTKYIVREFKESSRKTDLAEKRTNAFLERNSRV